MMLKSKLPGVMESMSLYLASKETEYILFKPIKVSCPENADLLRYFCVFTYKQKKIADIVALSCLYELSLKHQIVIINPFGCLSCPFFPRSSLYYTLVHISTVLY